jgi:agmatine/peptidylarginine deiminase
MRNRSPARLLPEWYPQWGVLIAWPHADSDWAPRLDEVEAVYRELARAVTAREELLILCRDSRHHDHIREQLTGTGVDAERVHFQQMPFDDTWTRDYGPLALEGPELADFTFNGWGGKYEARQDNSVNARIPWRAPLRPSALVLEGGAIDTDGVGTLLTTRGCMRHAGRNPNPAYPGLEARIRDALGVDDIIELEHGALAGDDTDGHVDMLARFCGPASLAYVQCLDERDTHHAELSALERELTALARARHWRLTPLPLPRPVHDEQGKRLPATYANFLILNDAVLMPIYGESTDEAARLQLQSAFPERVVETVYCRPLLHQGGSLHCATLQLPEGSF